MKKLEFKDPDLVLMCAFRYALGRKTYVVHSIVEEMLENWDVLSNTHKKLIQKEIKDHEELYGNLGMEMDRDQWYRILKLEI